MGYKHGTPMAFYPTLMIIVIAFMIIPEISAQTTDDSSSSSVPAEGNMLDQSNNVSDPIQQQDDTVRVDPLDNLNKYRGGYDITNKHYWSSTAFTGIHGYALGVLWLVCGILFGLFLLAKVFWYKHRKSSQGLKKRSACHRQCHLWPVLISIFFTLLAMVASGVVLGGNARFYSEAKSIVDIIIDTANDASETLYNTTGAMKIVRDNIEASGVSAEAEDFLTSTSQELDGEADNIHRQAKKNRRKIDLGLKIVFIVTTSTISLNLIAVIALSVFGILRLQRALRLLIVLCWLLTTLCLVYFGFYFFLNEFAEDTCTALQSFKKNPYNNSLSSLLPCDELLSTKSALLEVGEGVHNLIDEVNANISVLTSSSVVYLCNPFSEPPAYEYQPENCSSNAIKIGDIPKIFGSVSCIDSDNATCGSGPIVLSDNDYKTVESYSSSVQDLLNAYPRLESLVECQSVTDAFSEILADHCKPVKKFIHMVWASMIALSMIMVFMVLLWTIRDHHEQSHHFSDGGSVGPHSSTANMLELGDAKAVKDNPNPSLV